MKRSLPLAATSLLLVLTAASAVAAPSIRTLFQKGVFQFPQEQSAVLVNRPDLKLSIWNSRRALYVQALVLQDDRKDRGDRSALMLDRHADGRIDAAVDRAYYLNPAPRAPGLYYVISQGLGKWSRLLGDSRGRGCIRYIQTAEGITVRVDSFLIPTEEVQCWPGDRIRLAYRAWSDQPALMTSSDPDASRAPKADLPRTGFREVVLGQNQARIRIQTSEVPRGRADGKSGPVASTAQPALGSAAPEISAGAWLNGPPELSLSAQRGKLVILAFWATWDPPCRKAMATLSSMRSRYADRGLVVIGLTREDRPTVESYLRSADVRFPLGVASSSDGSYGVTGLPMVFLIGPQGRVVWKGPPGTDLDRQIHRILVGD